MVRIAADPCPPAQIWGIARRLPKYTKWLSPEPVAPTKSSYDIDVFHVVTAILETVSGRRSPSQLWRWVAPAIASDIEKRAKNKTEARIQLCRLHVQDQGNAKETVAIVKDGQRMCAIALRLELIGNCWICTQLEWN